MEKKLFIEGMSCGHCVSHVKEALQEIDGVTLVEVNLESKYARVEGVASDEDLKAAVEEAGYDVVQIENL